MLWPFAPSFLPNYDMLKFRQNFKINKHFTSLQTPLLLRKFPSFYVPIVDISLIFKTQHIDLEISTSKSQKSFVKPSEQTLPHFSLSWGSSKRSHVNSKCWIHCLLAIVFLTSIEKKLLATCRWKALVFIY